MVKKKKKKNSFHSSYLQTMSIPTLILGLVSNPVSDATDCQMTWLLKSATQNVADLESTITPPFLKYYASHL